MRPRRSDPVGPGQESVWDYPRPPRVETFPGRVRVEFGGAVVLDTVRALRVLETSHPPGYYVPREAVLSGVLVPTHRSSWCEFKGRAVYFDLVVGDRRSPAAAWAYPEPAVGYAALTGTVSLYPGRTDGCWINEERVRAQVGDFYGGWITDAIVGPFKGQPGTSEW